MERSPVYGTGGRGSNPLGAAMSAIFLAFIILFVLACAAMAYWFIFIAEATDDTESSEDDNQVP